MYNRCRLFSTSVFYIYDVWRNLKIRLMTENNKEPLHLRLYSSQPRNYNQSATVKLTLDPACRYQISIRSSLIGTLGQLARFYSGFLIVNVAVVILMALRHQLKTASTERSCSFFLSAVNESAKPFKVLPFVKMFAFILSFEPLSKVLLTTDLKIITDEGFDFLLLPLLLYICSAGIVWVLALALSAAIIISESTIQRIALMFLARSFAGNLAFSDYLMAGLHKLPVIVATGLIVLCFCTCGGLALCVGAVFYFLKLTQMSQEFVEQLVWSLVKNGALYVKSLFKKRKQEEGNRTEEQISSEASRDAVEEIVENQENIVDSQEDIVRSEEIKNSEETETSKDKEINEDKPEENESSEEEERSVAKQNDETEKEENVADKEEVSSKEVPLEKEKNERVSLDTAIFFHFTLFLIWSLVAALCIPSVLTWAHNFSYSARLVPDPSFWPGIILCLCAIPLWQLDLPKFNRKWYKLTSEIIFILAITSLLYAVISLYRLVYLLTFSIALVTVHQLLAPVEDEAPSVDETKETTYVDRVKAKWE